MREGYNVIAGKYYQDRYLFKNKEQLDDFVKHLPEKSVVLDIGCGGGVPVLKTMIESGFKAKGIDFSKGMLELAKKNVPEAELVLGDVMKTEFETGSFDGIICNHSHSSELSSSTLPEDLLVVEVWWYHACQYCKDRLGRGA